MQFYAVTADGHMPDEIRLVRSAASAVALPVEQLSEREREVLTYIASGLQYSDAAALICISERTFRDHAWRINAKLATNNIVLSVTYGLAAGIIAWPDIERLWRQHLPHLVEV